MKHITNASFNNYKDLWQSIFGNDYRDKYQHGTGLSGGGGDYPFYDIHLKQDVILYPFRRFKLASSYEHFNVPKDWYLLTKNKSTIARQGIDASFNTLIDNGWSGFLTIEIVNHSFRFIRLKAGQPILKVVAVKCDFPCEAYNGKYQNQDDKPVGAR
jgi:dCTP deaminase